MDGDRARFADRLGGPLSPGAGFLPFLGMVLTGGLIYRDILRRERRV